MEPNPKKLIAEFVKNGRLAKGLTQKELAEQTRISVRSIQRIENAELIPRSYTLKTIAECLGIPFEDLQLLPGAQSSGNPVIPAKATKWILSAGLSVVIVFLAAAFLSQSARFPETTFESFLFWAAIVFVLTLVLLFIWRNKG